MIIIFNVQKEYYIISEILHFVKQMILIKLDIQIY